MKPDRLFIGKLSNIACKQLPNGLLVQTMEDIDDNVLLLKTNEKGDKYFSPKHHTFYSTTSQRISETFISEIRKFNYGDLQNKKFISYLGALKLHNTYLNDLIDPRDLYLCEIREAIEYEGIGKFEEEKIIDGELIGHTWHYLSARNYRVVSNMELVKKVEKYYYSPRLRKMYETEPTGDQKQYARNIVPFEYGNIRNKDQIPMSEAQNIYRRYIKNNYQ